MRNELSTPRVDPKRLEALGYATYTKYLAAPRWQELRRRLRAEHPERWKCEVCESTEDLNVHHRTYRRFGRERLGDLIVLCETHHHALHETYWSSNTHWTLWNFGRDWIDHRRQELGLRQLYRRG